MKKNPAFHFVLGSIADKAVVSGVFSSYQPDIVVNLAAQAGVRYSIDNPDSYICLLYTSDAADDPLCVDLGGRRILKKKKKKTGKTRG